jgi:hypothetical protein
MLPPNLFTLIRDRYLALALKDGIIPVQRT